MEGQDNTIRRRSLLKTAGFFAAAGVPLAAAAFIARRTKVSGRIYKRAWWIKKVRRPTLSEKNAAFQRFSGDNIFEIYKPLKAAREGATAFESEQAEKRTRLAKWMNKGSPVSACAITSSVKARGL